MGTETIRHFNEILIDNIVNQIRRTDQSAHVRINRYLADRVDGVLAVNHPSTLRSWYHLHTREGEVGKVHITSECDDADGLSNAELHIDKSNESLHIISGIGGMVSIHKLPGSGEPTVMIRDGRINIIHHNVDPPIVCFQLRLEGGYDPDDGSVRDADLFARACDGGEASVHIYGGEDDCREILITALGNSIIRLGNVKGHDTTEGNSYDDVRHVCDYDATYRDKGIVAIAGNTFMKVRADGVARMKVTGPTSSSQGEVKIYAKADSGSDKESLIHLWGKGAKSVITINATKAESHIKIEDGSKGNTTLTAYKTGDAELSNGEKSDMTLPTMDSGCTFKYKGKSTCHTTSGCWFATSSIVLKSE